MTSTFRALVRWCVKSTGVGTALLMGSALLVGTAAMGETQGRYPKPVERPRPAVGADGKPLVTLEGRWYSDFGFMNLGQEQWNFEGTYSCCQGKIRGELVGDQIEFFWQDPVYGEGWGYFRLDSEARQLDGVWGLQDDMGSSGRWRAVRLEPRSYDGGPTHWRFAALHPHLGELQGEVLLAFAGAQVAGQLEGSTVGPSPFPDKTHRHEIFRYLEGHRKGAQVLLQWRNPLTDRVGEMHLEWGTDTMEGRWHLTEELVVPIRLSRTEDQANP